MLTASSNPQIRQLQKWQSKASARREDGIFLAEGLRLVSEAPPQLVRKLYLSEHQAAQDVPELALLVNSVPCETVADDLFPRISSTQTPQGVLAVLDRPSYSESDVFSVKNPLFLVCETLQDPGNLGTIFRSAEAAGVSALLLSSDSVDPFSPKVVRSTMGAIFRVPFLLWEDGDALMRRLKSVGVTSYAAHLQGKVLYHEPDFAGPTAFLIGNEGNGLSDHLASLADTYLKIPMAGRAESLNASVAASLLMYEAYRARAFAQPESSL